MERKNDRSMIGRRVCSLMIAGLIAAGVALPAAQAERCYWQGPGLALKLVPALATHVFNECLVGGELAVIRVSGDGDTDLDLFVFDPDGVQVAADRDLSDECLALFVPEKTGTYRIEVRNLGYLSNLYAIGVD